ncbi:integral membrane protein [soil metagenome]
MAPDDVDALQRRAAETWFLDNGLPAVLRPGALVRRLWPRSAPALAGLAVFMVWSVVIVLMTGKHTIDIDGRPTRTEWFVLALLVLVLPLTALVGWLVSRLKSISSRTIASLVSVVLVVVGVFFGGPSSYVLTNAVLAAVCVVAVLALTASGVGSILGWAANVTLNNLALTGTLLVRALPFVLLTVLVFFNTYIWLMAEYVGRTRLMLALLLFGLIAVAFIASSIADQVKPMLSGSGHPGSGDDSRLTGTPFAAIADLPGSDQYSRAERWNVIFVLAVSQVVQVAVVALVTSGIFFLLGLILLNPKLLAEWTRGGSSDGTILTMTLPVPQALIQTTMFLGALTFMNVSAKAVGDSDYKSRFLDPLIDDLRVTLVARNRYRGLPER